MEIYRRIVNENDKSDDCIYQLVYVYDFGYRWHYRRFTKDIDKNDFLTIYKKSNDKYRLDGILDFDPQDLELTDGNNATSSE